MEKVYDIEDIIILDNREYCIIKKYNDYYVIISLTQPLDIKVGTFLGSSFSVENDNEKIKEVLCS